MNHNLRLFLGAFFACILLSITALGQATGGRASGRIVDATGAVVPNATVTLTNDETGQAVTAQTNALGYFSFPNVAVGKYLVKSSASGFETTMREVTVVLNQESIVEMSLHAGKVADSTTVSAASAGMIQKESSMLGAAYSNRQIEELPVFDDHYSLSLLSPNVVGTAAGVVGAGGTIGGTRPRGNSFNVDGVNNDDPSVTGPSTRLIHDAIEEFTVLTNSFNAEFGSVAGGQFNTITKSGTNSFRGSMFGYLQNEAFNASDSAGARPMFRDYRYGGTFGGPIKKDKLFFFGAYQYQSNAQSAYTSTYLAPTSDGLNQISGFAGASPYIVNLLQSNLTLAPAATTTMTVLGQPNIPFGTVAVSVPTGWNEHMFQANIDHLWNDRNQFRYRFSFDRKRAEQPGGGGSLFNNLQTYDSQLASATWIKSFGGTVVNDARLAFRRITENYPLANTNAGLFPNLIVSSLNLNLGPNSSLPQGAPANNSYQLADSLSWLKGRHNFKFGADVRKQVYSQRFLQFARGYYDYASFDELLMDQSPSGTSSIRGVGSDGFTGNQFKYGFFGQDDWKVTNRLVMNVGMRYEYSTLPRDLASQSLNSIASLPGVLEFNKPKTDRNNFGPRLGVAYSPSGSGAIGHWLFGGEGRSVIRGGVGISYYDNFYNLSITSLPPQFQQLLTPASANAAFGLDPLRPFLQSGGIPNQLMPLTDAASARAATGSYIPDQISPLALSWSVSVQREITPHTVIEFRYLGTKGMNLPVQMRLNAAPVVSSALVLPTFLNQPDVTQLAGLPTLGDALATTGVGVRPLAADGFTTNLTSYQFLGRSRYDSGSVSINHRMSKGLAFTGAYTWSATLDNATNEFNSSAINPRRPQNFSDLRNEWARSALDIPHRVAVSFSYDVPFFNSLSNRFMRSAFGGWQVNGIFQAQSGQPITVLSGLDSNLNGDSVADRAILNPSGIAGTGSGVTPIDVNGLPVAMNSPATVAYVANNPNAQYITAGPGAQSTAGRNTLRTLGFNRTDALLSKTFEFGERGKSVRFGAEVFDLFNQQPRTVSGVGAMTGAFATAGNPFFNNYSNGTYSGRMLQLRAKITF